MEANILLVDGEPTHARSIARTLRAAGACVETTTSLDDESNQENKNLILLNYDFVSTYDSTLLEKIKKIKKKIVFYSAPLSIERNKLVFLLENLGLTNFLARNLEVDSEDLLTTVQKIIRKDIFGIEKYFSWGTQKITFKTNTSENKNEIISAAAELAQKVGLQNRLTNLFCTVVDEFFTNALYNAPVDNKGQYRFSHFSRTQEVELDNHEFVDIVLACDSRRIGVSITDPFGSLSEAKTLEYLAKCFRKGEDQIDKKEGGAGLGLYSTFESLSHFIINLQHNKKTEMIGLLDIRGSHKDFVSKGKSFNIFVE